jgi:hypothetical protein
MNKEQIKKKYYRFKQWQEQPFDYKLICDEEQHCNNCGNDFTGNYCPYCSQKAGVGRIGWHSVRQGVMDIWGLGTRSLLNSIWQLLLRPGYVISDYISGKRQVSFPPVKMLFIVAVIYSFVSYWLLPNVLNLPVEEDLDSSAANEMYLWFKNHYSWAMLIISTLAILPTWVMFHYSPRQTGHSLPEGFFIQFFFQVIVVVVTFLLLPLDYVGSDTLSMLSMLIIMCYYVVGYKQLFGYSWWGTLWRQGFVLLCGALTLLFVVIIAFPQFFDLNIRSDNPHAKQYGYIAAVIVFLMLPLIVISVGHLINLIATRKIRRELKNQATK